MKVLSIYILSLAMALGACDDDDDSVLARARATPALSTFTAVLEFASDNGDLLEVLSDRGSITVFAPNNAAFDRLAVELTGRQDAVAGDLLVAENRPLLRSVLLYHVLDIEVVAAAIPFGRAIQTVEGGVFKIEPLAPPTIIDGRNRMTTILEVDLRASNGVIHITDRVLLPANMTITETALSLAADAQLRTLVDALVATDLDVVLAGPGPFTVLAPTDAAFDAVVSELGTSRAALLSNTALLTTVLTYHVIPGRVFEAELPLGVPIATVEGNTVRIDDSLVIVDGRGRRSRIVLTDVMASNGVIHLIDVVLLPP